MKQNCNFKLSMIYKRLDSNKPGYTVTGSGGGGTHIYHWNEPRALTNRERCRLQTFPDNFILFGSKESVRRQLGMAVPVEGAKIILKSILKTFSAKKNFGFFLNISCRKKIPTPLCFKLVFLKYFLYFRFN